MSSRTDPTSWMWAHACDLLAQAETMHQQFFRLGAGERRQAVWQPPADVFEDDEGLLIVVALPGVAADRVEITSENGTLVIRAERPLPFVGSDLAVRQLEIPYGFFERRIALPAMSLELASHELTHGCLMLRLRKRR